MVDIIKEKGLKYVFDQYNVKQYLTAIAIIFIANKFIWAIITFTVDPIPFILQIVHVAVSLLLYIGWGFLFARHLQEKAYSDLTGGRHYGPDHFRFQKSFSELVQYFADADPVKMDEESLPIMKWQDSHGLIFGKYKDRLISFEPQKNGIVAMVWGAPGDGKTTSTIITSARQFGLYKNPDGTYTQKGAVMVTDLKGDIFEANREYRTIKRFSTIHPEDSWHYDPLVDARKMKATDRATAIENMTFTLIPDEESSESKYFIDGAREFFTGISLYLLNKNNNISFPAIVDQIVRGNFSNWVMDIMNSDDHSAQSYCNHFWGENEKNVSGCYSKMVTSIRIFGSETMKTLLANDGKNISPQDLENCVDVYIQVDPNQMAMLSPIIAMIYQAFMSQMLYRKEGQQPPIAFILDEFGQLPAMPVISQSAALMRAYNCSLMFCNQSLAMIEKKYGTSGRKILMDCAKAHCFLSIMDPDTRDWASRLIGTKKVLKVSQSLQQGNNVSSGRAVSEARENIFEPESFGNLPNEDAVVIYYNGKYIKAEKTYYFKD